jgi:hypothetical protein
MKTKLLTAICVLAITVGFVTPSRAIESEDQGLAVIADAAVVRPGCLVATVFGSAVFVVSLPITLISKSVKTTAKTLVVQPAKATFTRPMGDMSALVCY